MNKKSNSKLEVILIVISVVIASWILLSWFDVISKNSEQSPTYSNLNFFNLLLKGNRTFFG